MLLDKDKAQSFFNKQGNNLLRNPLQPLIFPYWTFRFYKYQYSLDEKKRIVILRGLSAGISVVITGVLQLDSFVMLSELIPKSVLTIFTTPAAHWGGIMLTGLSTSAGSSFWHDQLAKVRAVKEVAGKSK